MSKLFQISMSDGISYLTREKDENEFYKQKFYKVKTGCIVVAPPRRQIQLYDLTKNEHVGPPLVLSNNIIRIQRVKKDSGLAELYTKITSDIQIIKPDNSPALGPKLVH